LTLCIPSTWQLYSSRARGIWRRQPHLVRPAPEGWKGDHQPQPTLRIGPPEEPKPELSVSAKQSRAAWARLTMKIYDADPLCCPRCHKTMKVIAVIIDALQVPKILRHLIKTGRLSGDSSAQHCESPLPGLDPASLN